ncbi:MULTISPECIES: MarR family transcriptional regulator [unclassified Phyllobacterium]|uniref:MarR family transcriptional regulator n=1 Tax=unclassified Phyllobacterium TaxID=2638441 RepID=UPI003012A3CD
MNWKVRWLERARRDPRMPPSAFRLAHGIAAAASRDGVVNLQVDQIAARCAISKPTIRLALDRLAALRYIDFRSYSASEPFSIEMVACQPYVPCPAKSHSSNH